MELYHYMAEVLRVVDGDTVDFRVDQGLHTFRDIRARLRGINAPERNAPGGSASTAFLATLLPQGSSYIIRTYKDPTDKYGRWIADVFSASGATVSALMVGAGHAVFHDY